MIYIKKVGRNVSKQGQLRARFPFVTVKWVIVLYSKLVVKQQVSPQVSARRPHDLWTRMTIILR